MFSMSDSFIQLEKKKSIYFWEAQLEMKVLPTLQLKLLTVLLFISFEGMG